MYFVTVVAWRFIIFIISVFFTILEKSFLDPDPKQGDTQMEHKTLLTRFNSFSVFYLNKCQLMRALMPRCPVGSSIPTSSGSTENRSLIQPFRQVRLVHVSSLLINVIYSFCTLTRAQVRVALMGAAKTTAVSYL